MKLVDVVSSDTCNENQEKYDDAKSISMITQQVYISLDPLVE
jgi:hypothetical protein